MTSTLYHYRLTLQVDGTLSSSPLTRVAPLADGDVAGLAASLSVRAGRPVVDPNGGEWTIYADVALHLRPVRLAPRCPVSPPG